MYRLAKTWPIASLGAIMLLTPIGCAGEIVSLRLRDPSLGETIVNYRAR